MMMWYYTVDRASRVGPVADAEMKDLIASGDVARDALVWREGLPNWLPVAEVRELSAALPPMAAEPVEIPFAAVALLPHPTPVPVQLAPSVIEIVSRPPSSSALEILPEDLIAIPLAPQGETGGTRAPAPVRPRVVGCPRCRSKLRAKRPGVILCPKCQAKVRVSQALFARGSA